ncbi:MAG: uroporphyrinogen-III C-methyltransferase [Bacteroidota bacterium]
MKPTPYITLLGAGPGDPDLLTIKGMKALEKAHVVLYDALASEALLGYTPLGCQHIFVGKRAGNHRYSQTHINQLMVQYAQTHGHVVRLKGGDPFIFGRGHEELSFAQAHGIPVQIVPGVSSLGAVPGLQQIPLTKRHTNDSFWVLTATRSGGRLSPDLYRAAETDATVVIFMGLRKLEEISRIFQEKGKARTPVAVIQSGSLPEEKVALGKVENIAARVESLGLSTPALIVIGEVVRFHPNFPHSQADSVHDTQAVPIGISSLLLKT